jgi:predicted nucleotidyltransferase component of viral defense system
LKPAARYSEDIDLVQVEAGAAGNLMDRLHAVLDPWLGKPRYKQTEGRVAFAYRFASEETPPIPLKLKVEINTREHFSVYGTELIPFEVRSRCFEGNSDIASYGLNELLGTKLRALYQRKKGRDLFDLDVALQHSDAKSQEILKAFYTYMDHGGHSVTRTQLEENITAKLNDPSFTADISPLLRSDFEWDMKRMAQRVSATLLAQIK